MTIDEALVQIRADDRGSIVRAARALADAKGAAVPLLRLLALEHRPENRLGITHALAWQGDVRAWWPLLKLAANLDERPDVRGQAAEGIGYLSCEKRRGSLSYRAGIAVLAACLEDASPEVRYDAAFALGATGDLDVISILEPRQADDGRGGRIIGSVGRAVREAIEDLRLGSS